MNGNGIFSRVLVLARRVWTLFVRPFTGKRAHSEEVIKLKQHLESANRDDAKLRDLTRRKDRLVHDNHLVSDVERALGLR